MVGGDVELVSTVVPSTQSGTDIDRPRPRAPQGRCLPRSKAAAVFVREVHGSVTNVRSPGRAASRRRRRRTGLGRPPTSRAVSTRTGRLTLVAQPSLGSRGVRSSQMEAAHLKPSSPSMTASRVPGEAGGTHKPRAGHRQGEAPAEASVVAVGPGPGPTTRRSTSPQRRATWSYSKYGGKLEGTYEGEDLLTPAPDSCDLIA